MNYTDETLEQLAKDGVKRVAIASPAFSADCLETLEVATFFARPPLQFVKCGFGNLQIGLTTL